MKSWFSGKEHEDFGRYLFEEIEDTASFQQIPKDPGRRRSSTVFKEKGRGYDETNPATTRAPHRVSDFWW